MYPRIMVRTLTGLVLFSCQALATPMFTIGTPRTSLFNTSTPDSARPTEEILPIQDDTKLEGALLIEDLEPNDLFIKIKAPEVVQELIERKNRIAAEGKLLDLESASQSASQGPLCTVVSSTHEQKLAEEMESRASMPQNLRNEDPLFNLQTIAEDKIAAEGERYRTTLILLNNQSTGLYCLNFTSPSSEPSQLSVEQLQKAFNGIIEFTVAIDALNSQGR